MACWSGINDRFTRLLLGFTVACEPVIANKAMSVCHGVIKNAFYIVYKNQ